MTVNPRDAQVHQFDPSNRFLMLLPGHTSLVTPNLFRKTLANVGTVVRTDVLLPSTPAQGQNVDLQLYCTNRANNLINSYMGEVRLNSLTPGAIRTVDIPLNASTRDACLGGPTGAFNFEFVLNTAAGFTRRTGVGFWRFGGTLTPTPADDVPPRCPQPGPTNPIPMITTTNPAWIERVGVVTNPNALPQQTMWTCRATCSAR